MLRMHIHTIQKTIQFIFAQHNTFIYRLIPILHFSSIGKHGVLFDKNLFMNL